LSREIKRTGEMLSLGTHKVGRLLLRYGLFAVVSMVCLAAMSGCGDPPVIDNTPPGVTGDLKVALSTVPDPPTREQSTTFVVDVRDAAGNPVEGATVTLSTKMVLMSHGGIKGELVEKGGGKYEATGAFNMGGTWRVEVTVTGAKGSSTPTTGKFDVAVK
jgi:hypothetical protein